MPPVRNTRTMYQPSTPRGPSASADPALPDHPDHIDPDSTTLPAPHRAARRLRAYLTASPVDGILDAADPGDGHPRPLYRRDLQALITHSSWAGDALRLCETQLVASRDQARLAQVTEQHTRQRLDDAAAALSDYFKGAPVGPDIAPRITEMYSDLMARAHAAERARDNAYAEREQLRYERRLLGAARLTLDLVAAGDQSRWPQARREAEDLAQRIVDEIGHPVTDEDALGPTYREQLARAEAARDRAICELNRVYTAGWYIADCLERHADSSGSVAVAGFAADLRAVLTGTRHEGSAGPDGIAAAAAHGGSAVSGGVPVQPGPVERAAALQAAATLLSGVSIDSDDGPMLVRDLEEGTVAMADRLTEWVCTGDYDWTSTPEYGSAGSGRAMIPPRRAGAHGCA